MGKCALYTCIFDTCDSRLNRRFHKELCSTGVGVYASLLLPSESYALTCLISSLTPVAFRPSFHMDVMDDGGRPCKVFDETPTTFLCLVLNMERLVGCLADPV